MYIRTLHGKYACVPVWVVIFVTVCPSKYGPEQNPLLGVNFDKLTIAVLSLAVQAPARKKNTKNSFSQSLTSFRNN